MPSITEVDSQGPPWKNESCFKKHVPLPCVSSRWNLANILGIRNPFLRAPEGLVGIYWTYTRVFLQHVLWFRNRQPTSEIPYHIFSKQETNGTFGCTVFCHYPGYQNWVVVSHMFGMFIPLGKIDIPPDIFSAESPPPFQRHQSVFLACPVIF